MTVRIVIFLFSDGSEMPQLTLCSYFGAACAQYGKPNIGFFFFVFCLIISLEVAVPLPFLRLLCLFNSLSCAAAGVNRSVRLHTAADRKAGNNAHVK